MKPYEEPKRTPGPIPDEPPDGRGERPTDPNELAKWIVDPPTDDHSLGRNSRQSGDQST